MHVAFIEEREFFSTSNYTSPGFDPKAEEIYEACLETMKDGVTEVILTVSGEKSGTYHSLHKKLDMFPKLNTIKMDYIGDGNFAVCQDFEAVSAKDNIKTLWIRPSLLDNFSFDTPITPAPDVETLTLDYTGGLNNSFMLYVMKKFPYLKKLNLDCFAVYVEHTVFVKPELVLFLEYLYSIQTVTDIFLQTKLEEITEQLMSLLKLLNEKQLQDTAFQLDFSEPNFCNNAAVIEFFRNNSRNRIFIRLLEEEIDCQKNLELMKDVGGFFYRLHLTTITKDLGKILNLISAYCPRLNSLIISHGGDPDLYCSSSNEAISQSHTIKRLEFRDYGITPHLFALISKQFPCLKDLVLYGFNNWIIPGSYFPLIAPYMSISYFRLRLDLYSAKDPFRFKKVFLKLETMEQETRYYDLDLESLEYIVENYLYPHINSTEAAYQESMDDDGYMTLFIRCKSVTKFVPTFSSSRTC